jgi:cyclic dehypoxanthinyl futalosine synthase
VSLPIAPLLDRAAAGGRLSREEGLRLLESHDLAALAAAADAAARRVHPEPWRTYNIDRNINYTNVCVSTCRFCAFSRRPDDPDAYVIEWEELDRKIEETAALGGNQILLQGGMHPALPLAWYEEMLRRVKQRFPAINVHGFSPPEIDHIGRISGLSVDEVLGRLREAGLGSLPGGGAEILVDRVRQEVSPCKVSAAGWLDVCRRWHRMGGRGSATMMFGHRESLADRIEHLDRLRALQDETGGFTAFIAWTFQPGNTALAGLRKLGAFEYLKTLAVSRLYLDNFANLQASWVTQGLQVGQLALRFGANDMGSLMIEENVVAAAGTAFRASEAEIRRAIAEAGYVARRRDVFYRLLDDVDLHYGRPQTEECPDHSL